MATDRIELPPRAAVADSLIERLNGPVDEAAEQDWRDEVAGRLRELELGAVATVAWDDVRLQLRNRSRA